MKKDLEEAKNSAATAISLANSHHNVAINLANTHHKNAIAHADSNHKNAIAHADTKHKQATTLANSNHFKSTTLANSNHQAAIAHVDTKAAELTDLANSNHAKAAANALLYHRDALRVARKYSDDSKTQADENKEGVLKALTSAEGKIGTRITELKNELEQANTTNKDEIVAKLSSAKSDLTTVRTAMTDLSESQQLMQTQIGAVQTQVGAVQTQLGGVENRVSLAIRNGVSNVLVHADKNHQAALDHADAKHLAAQNSISQLDANFGGKLDAQGKKIDEVGLMRPLFVRQYAAYLAKRMWCVSLVLRSLCRATPSFSPSDRKYIDELAFFFQVLVTNGAMSEQWAQMDADVVKIRTVVEKNAEDVASVKEAVDRNAEGLHKFLAQKGFVEA